MTFHDLFDVLDKTGIEYVVPRKYDNLPEDTVDDNGDVDIIIHPDHFNDGIKACETIGFGSGNKSTFINRLVNKTNQAVSKPQKTVKILLFDQQRILREMRGTQQNSQNVNKRHTNIKLQRGWQKLDLRNNLAYKSPSTDKRYPVQLEVTYGMLERRVKTNGFYKPHPSDELAHIIPHCIYDKYGEFSAYYVERCETLLETVQADNEKTDLLIELLELIFYEAGELVYELLLEQRYDEMRSQLKKFSDY